METKNKDWFTLGEAAVYLGKPIGTVRGWFQERHHSNFKDYCTKIGGKRIVTKENMRKFINQMEPMNVKSEDK